MTQPIPERIYLQSEEPVAELLPAQIQTLIENTTWCQSRVNEHDLEYLSAEAVKKEREELVKSLQFLLKTLQNCGDWDDGCFYYHGHSASELEVPMKTAERILAKHKGTE